MLLKLVLLFLEQNIEGGQGAVAFGDVLLKFHFLAVVEFFLGVDLLFQHAEVVADHHDFGMEKNLCGLSPG